MSRDTFLNISNHPSSGWSEAQRSSALALADLSTITDWPSSELQVDPSAHTAEVAAIAASIAQRIIDDGYQHAMVAGEPVLVWHLVNHLSTAGVACYAATTARAVTEEVLEDGSLRKVTRFQFVRWRTYIIEGSDSPTTTIPGET